jgi:hypothetical protein
MRNSSSALLDLRTACCASSVPVADEELESPTSCPTVRATAVERDDHVVGGGGLHGDVVSGCGPGLSNDWRGLRVGSDGPCLRRGVTRSVTQSMADRRNRAAKE